MALYVYILECSDELLYTGITNNIDRRLAEHQEGIDPYCFTYKRRPVELKYAEKFDGYMMAIAWEKRIKRWSAQKKRALINENWDRLKDLATCRNQSHWENRD